jgi:hypothetical protein
MPSPQDQYDAAAERLSIGTDPASVRYRIETMERLLERMFVIPGINRPVGFDMLISAIPFVGAIPDLFFRSNSRNLRIILRHLDKHHPATRTIEGEAIRLD